MSSDAEEMLRFDLENDRQTIIPYRRRIREAEAKDEFAPIEVPRTVVVQELEHFMDLADALGIDNPVMKEQSPGPEISGGGSQTVRQWGTCEGSALP